MFDCEYPPQKSSCIWLLKSLTIIHFKVEQIYEKKVPKHLQVSVDVLADCDPRVPQHLRSGHWTSPSAALAWRFPGEKKTIIADCWREFRVEHSHWSRSIDILWNYWMFQEYTNLFFVCLFTCEMLLKMYALGLSGYMVSLFNRSGSLRSDESSKYLWVFSDLIS